MKSMMLSFTTNLKQSMMKAFSTIETFDFVMCKPNQRFFLPVLSHLSNAELALRMPR